MSTSDRILPPPGHNLTPNLIVVEFSWGTLVERRSRQWVFWDFVLTPLRQRFQDAGYGPEVCQAVVFQALERRFPCTTRDLVTLLEQVETWMLFPGTAQSTFVLVAHCVQESAARRWVVRELFPALPLMIDHAQHDLVEAGRAE